MNEESHWDTIASNYNDEIFDVFKSDKKGILPVYFRKHANKNHTALDFGCGNGKSFSYLAPYFGSIVAIDISQKLINQAQTRAYSNIEFMRMDLSKRNLKLPKVDFVFCCNVIMLPEIERNFVMIKNIRKALKTNSAALVVLPSFDSIFYSAWRLIEWYRKEGVKPDKIPDTEFNYFKGSKRDLLQGIFYIDGVPTKHYSHSEIEVLFNEAGLKITAIEKLEYDWNTEFADPPKWMQRPFPWDWMVECRLEK